MSWNALATRPHKLFKKKRDKKTCVFSKLKKHVFFPERRHEYPYISTKTVSFYNWYYFSCNAKLRQPEVILVLIPKWYKLVLIFLQNMPT